MSKEQMNDEVGFTQLLVLWGNYIRVKANLPDNRQNFAMRNSENFIPLGESLDMSKVNLDALIPKADFAEDKTIQGATDLQYLNIQHFACLA